MAGERELEAAAHRGTGEGRDPRLTGRLQLAVDLAEPAAALEHHRDRGVLALRLEHRVVVGALALQHRQVGAAAERVLARGHHRALDRGVGRNLLDDLLEFFHDRDVDHVHRAAGHVPGDERDAVAV
jgi:hypothetical protein